jgi:hypothetical protein
MKMINEDLKGKKVLVPGTDIGIGSAKACLREPEFPPHHQNEEYQSEAKVYHSIGNDSNLCWNSTMRLLQNKRKFKECQSKSIGK